jgi:hypothetical protein
MRTKTAARIRSRRPAASRSWVVFVALTVPAVLPGQDPIPEMVLVEGTIALIPCPFSFPVCFLEGDPGYQSYRVLQDAACLEWLGRHVRLWGAVSLGGCDPLRPETNVGIVPDSIEEITESAICGDVNRDQEVNLTDAIVILEHLFIENSPRPVPSLSDVNADGKHDLTDGIYLLQFLFRGGPGPACP